MKKKYWLYLVVAVILVLMFVASSWGKPIPGMKPGEEKLYFKWTAGMAYRKAVAPGFKTTAAEWFFDEMEKRTGGRFKVDVVYGGALGRQTEMPALTGSGVIELGHICQCYHPDIMPLGAIGWMPFWSPNEGELIGPLIQYAFDHPLAQAEMKRLNLINVLHDISLPQYGLVVSKRAPEIKSTKDFKGLQFRAYGAWGLVWKELGAVPVTLAAHQAYEGMQKGMIDTSLGGTNFLTIFQLGEVADRYIEGTLVGTGGAWAANLDAWNKLPQYIKDLWYELRPARTKMRLAEQKAIIKAAYQYIEKQGIKVTRLEDYENLEAAGAKAWDKWVAHSLTVAPGKQIREFLKDNLAYRKQLTGKDWTVYRPR